MTLFNGAMVVDYLVFVVFIVAAFLIPLWSKIRSQKKQTMTKADYVFATGNVSMAAMMLSIARGTLGVRSFLGYPSELYYRGSGMWETLYGLLLAYPIVSYVFVPVYYSLGITSVYQYLDMRFKSKLVQCLASLSYMIRSLFNMAVIIFTPCVALRTVIGLPYLASIIGITTISVVLTVMGGLKAAILSDVIQGLTMIGVSIIIIVQGVIDVGGIGTVYNITSQRGRLDFFDFNLDPTIRVTTVSATIGQLFMSLSILGCQQNFVQRYCSMSSQRKVVKTMLTNVPVMAILFSLSWVVGMVIFANYADCDPLSLGYISKVDEIVPFYVEDKFRYLPGLLGLVMATLFNSALALAVSNLNSLATVTFEDFFKRIPRFNRFNDKQQLSTIKSISVVWGILIVAASYSISKLSGVIESWMLMTSATSGPLLGVFILAILIPCANWKGAAVGMMFSYTTALWLTFGRLSLSTEVQNLPLSTAGCHNESFSTWMKPEGDANFSWASNASKPIFFNEHSNPSTNPTGIEYLYSLTYMYYAFIGSMGTVLIGIIVSLLTADPKADMYEEHLLHPMILKVSKYLPGKQRLYASSMRLDTENNCTIDESTASTDTKEPCKLSPVVENCQIQLNVDYIQKLNVLKNASLDVTNEIKKGTAL